MTAFGFSGTGNLTLSTSAASFPFTTEYLKTHAAFHDTSVDNTKIFAPVNGWYLLCAQAFAGTNGPYALFWRVVTKLGATTDYDYNLIPDSNQGGCVVRVIHMCKGDHAELRMSCTTGTPTGTAYATVVRMPTPMFVGAAVGNSSGAAAVSLAETLDTGGWHSDSTNPERVTVPTTGNYMFACYVRPTSSGTQRNYELRKNGSTVLWTLRGVSKNGGDPVYSPAVGVVPLTAGDYVQLNVDGNSGEGQLSLAYLDAGRAAHISQTTPTTIANGIYSTVVPYDTETVDTTAFHTTSAPNNKYVIVPSSNAGIYAAFGLVTQAGVSHQASSMRINGSLTRSEILPNTNVGFIGATGQKDSSGLTSTVLSLSVADTIETYAGNDNAAGEPTVIDGTYLSAVCLDDFTYLSPDRCPGDFIPQIYRVKRP